MSVTTNMTRSAFPIIDMMLSAQQIGLRAMTIYQPVVSAFLNSAKTMQSENQRGAMNAVQGRAAGTGSFEAADEEQVIGVGEEILQVGTRMVPGKTTRVRRVVVETPVQRDVTLHTETVVVERRKPLTVGEDKVLTEVTVEMSDASEIPVVSKSVHLVEEVLLRKEVTARIETIHDTLKRDKLEVEQPSQLPVVVSSAPPRDVKEREEKRSFDEQDKKQTASQPNAASKVSDLKRQQNSPAE